MSSDATAAVKVRIHLLGPFTVERDDQPIPPDAWERRRAFELLQLLAISPGGRLSRNELIDLLWPEKDSAGGANNLHRAIHDLRKVIGSDAIRVEKSAVRLGDGVWVDVAEFEKLIGDADFDRRTGALAMYGELCAGSAMSERIALERDHLRQKFIDAALGVVPHVISRDKHRAIDLLRRVLAADATNEQALRLLMRCLADGGRRAEALRQYAECKRALREQLDAAPSAQTTALFDTLAKEEETPPRPQLLGWQRVARRLLGSGQPPATRGRSEALALIDEFTSGNAGVLLLVGEAGIGKTHAAVEGARLAAARGSVLFCTAALEFERAIPYGPFVEAWNDHLRASSLGIEHNPFIGFSPTPDGNPQEDKLRLFESARQSLEALAGSSTIYFVLDDLHFADESSLHLFHYLARAARTMPLLLVGTYRDEEVALNPPLNALASSLYRERLGVRVALDRLDREATRSLIDDRLGRNVSDDTLTAIYRLTEGNPFFTEEVVQSMRDDIDASPAVPADLASFITDRVQRLGTDVEQLLTAAAVIGQSFDFDLARAVAGLGAGGVRALELGLAARLIEEDEPRYRFRHGLVRESLHQRISRVRKRELHEAVANAMESATPDLVEDLALHLRKAGKPERALPYLMASAFRAAARLGLAEAVNFLRQALVAMDELKLPPDEQRFQVLLRLGQMNLALSNLDSAVEELDAAASLARTDGWRPSANERAEARRYASLALITGGKLEEANARLEEAMNDLSGEATSPQYPHVLYHLAQLRWHEGRHREAYRVAERCLREAERQGDPQLIANGYEILSLSCHSLGEWKSGVEFEERRRALVGSTVDVAQAFDVHL
ncbi:MAG TPA: BTAD domain-containing putative transcriptional regulator [Thermoanaerobaculia bacterium]|nr:BTAD domain-containing putative transcriptional regulator [Thermoanaerobaculia bacterium]